MATLDEVLRELKGLQSKLFRQVLMSYVFSIVGVLMAEGKFDLSFKALTELVAGTLGTAGILSSYFSGAIHPSEEFDFLLGFSPLLASIKVVFGLGISAALFYASYFLAQLEYKVCAFVLAIGMFFFFRTMTSTVLDISKIQQQRALWQSMSLESRQGWFKRREDVRRRLRESADWIDELNRATEAANKLVRNTKRENRILRIKTFFKLLWIRSFPMRKKLHLVSATEQFEADQLLREFKEQMTRDAVQKVRSGTIRPLFLEGTHLQLFETDGRKYFQLEGPIDQETAHACLLGLARLKNVADKPFADVTAILEPSAQISFEAKKLFREEGVELFVVGPAS